MKIYVYSKCSTCQDALKFLKKHNIQFTQVEIVETPPSIEELEQMLAFKNGQLKKLFNTSGMLYREMKVGELLETMSTAEALKLLNTHGMLVKRPFLISKGVGLTGFKEEDYSKNFLTSTVSLINNV